MIDTIMHIREDCPFCKTKFKYLMANDNESREAIDNYKPYQPLRNRITAIKGAEKLRSIKQLNLYWAACGFVAKNRNPDIPELKYWNTKENVDHQIRVALHFVDENCIAVDRHGVVQWKYKSIALKNLKHIQACDYFNRAYPLMTAALGMESDEALIKAVKFQMLNF